MMLKTLNDVIDYIEDNLEEGIRLEDVAKYIGESDYHFRKIFQYISGMPLSEYIKKRKLSQAGQELVEDRKSTRLNSSHVAISYAVFCLKKKKKITHNTT